MHQNYPDLFWVFSAARIVCRHKILKRGSQFGYNFDPSVAKNFFVINFHDGAIPILLSALDIKTDRVIVLIRSLSELDVSRRNQ